jgi:hypothetical protein
MFNENIANNQYLNDKINELNSAELRKTLYQVAETVIDTGLTVQSKLMGVNSSYQKLRNQISEMSANKDFIPIYEKEDMETAAELMKYFSINLENDPKISSQISQLATVENNSSESLEQAVNTFKSYSSLSKQNNEIIDMMKSVYNSYNDSQNRLLSNIFDACSVSNMGNYNGRKSRLLQDRYSNLTDLCKEAENLVKSDTLSRQDLEYAMESYEALEQVVGSNKRVYNVHAKRYNELKSESKVRELTDSEIKKLNYSGEVIKSHGKLKRASNNLYETIDEHIDTFPAKSYNAGIRKFKKKESKNNEQFEEKTLKSSKTTETLNPTDENIDQGETFYTLVLGDFSTPQDLVQLLSNYKNKKELELKKSTYINPTEGNEGQYLLGFMDNENLINPEYRNLDENEQPAVVPVVLSKKKHGNKILSAILAGVILGGSLLMYRGCEREKQSKEEYKSMQANIATLVSDNKDKENQISEISNNYNQLVFNFNSLSNELSDAKSTISSNKVVLSDYQKRLLEADKESKEADKVLEGRISDNASKIKMLESYHQPTNEVSSVIDKENDYELLPREGVSELVLDSYSGDFMNEENKSPWYKKIAKGTSEAIKRAWKFTGISQYAKNAGGITNIEYIDNQSVRTDYKKNWEDMRLIDDVFVSNLKRGFGTTKLPTGENKRLLDYPIQGASGLWNATVGNILARGVDGISYGLNFITPDSLDNSFNYIRIAPYWAKRLVGGNVDGEMSLNDVINAPGFRQVFEDIKILADVEHTSYDANLDGKFTIGDLTGFVPLVSQARQDHPDWEDKRNLAQDIAETLPLWVLLDWLSGDGSSGGNGGSGNIPIGGGSVKTPGVGGN